MMSLALWNDSALPLMIWTDFLMKHFFVFSTFLGEMRGL